MATDGTVFPHAEAAVYIRAAPRRDQERLARRLTVAPTATAANESGSSDELNSINLLDLNAFDFRLRRTQKRSVVTALSSSRFLNEFCILRWIGIGGFGSVCAALHRLDLHEYAVKLVPFALAASSTVEKMLRELRTMARLPSHRNIVRYFGGWMEELSDDLSLELSKAKVQAGEAVEEIDESYSSTSSSSSSREKTRSDHVLFIQMELCRSATLRSWLRSQSGQVDATEAIAIFHQMLEGVQHMHQYGIVHRDLKPENLFLDESKVLKIGDFGLSSATSLSGEAPSPHGSQSLSDTSPVGTLSYAAPEQLSSTDHSLKVDVYALGMCLLELFGSFKTQMERAVCFSKARAGSLETSFAERHPHIASLVSWMTCPRASERPSVLELLSAPVLKSCPSPSRHLLVEQLELQIRRKDDLIRSLQQKLDDLSTEPTLQLHGL